MKTTRPHAIYFILLISVFQFLGCSSKKRVQFQTPVDTTSKRISIQTKQTYSLEDIGVYASNEFDGARLNGFLKENDSTVLVIITPENAPINNSAFYAFKTWSTNPGPFYFKFQYPIGYDHRYIPKIKVKNNWTIIDTSSVFVKDSIVSIKLNLSSEPITVAAQEIHSSQDVKNWYTQIAKGREEFVKIKSAGKSVLGRDLPVLDIYKGNKKNKDLIVLLTRQHPPEVTGYYAFQSFLSTILSDHKLSDKFFSKYRVLAFPILNPDGVDLGHWRHNAGGIDLNRDWSVYNQPEIENVVKFINKNITQKLVLGLDFHSTWFDIFYTNESRENTPFPNFEKDWFAGLEENIPDYKVNEEIGNSTEPLSKGWFLYGHNAVTITYEVADDTPRDSIELIGRIAAEQMMDILLNK